MIALLVTLLTVGCFLFLGVGLWVLVEDLWIIEVPRAISQPLKFRILCFAFYLLLKWGNILERLRICSMPHVFQFVCDRLPKTNDPNLMVTNMRFGTIKVRLYQPKETSSSLRRGIVFYHGGGMVMGSLDFYHNVCNFLAQKSNSVLLSVGYRKLPDYHFPVGHSDCLNVTIHFLKALKMYGVDPSRVVVCGDSIGGGAVALVTQALGGRTDLPKLRAQILIYPGVQAINLQLPSYQQNKNVPFLTRDFMFTCFSQYFRVDPCWKDALLTGACIPAIMWEKYKKWVSSDNLPERFRNKNYKPEFHAPFNEAAYLESRQLFDAGNAPLLVEDQVIAQVPEALIVTCEWDVLRDDGLLYKKRLEDQGVPVSWYHAENGFHGCLTFLDGIFSFPCSLNIANAIINYLKNI
ncbi:arylacetamide deacetylase-like 4 [Perognathus longimembris pacificus]|uniref:arylacetamide deacetylase-like 4 n=1 Tax=Perognathus longimembris pacificus TaxID=214514 RepID=UPI0020196BED|nr:arylacetamide deacetylase-like 4 [Perognathus longimembris pacificus]